MTVPYPNCPGFPSGILKPLPAIECLSGRPHPTGSQLHNSAIPGNESEKTGLYRYRIGMTVPNQ